MKKIFQLFLVSFVCTTAAICNPQDFDPLENQTIVIDNMILAKVRNKPISVLDVTKKMDMVFHQAYPELADSKAARFEFYTNSWKYVLNDMINTELIIADAAEKKLQLSDGEIREEIESRFGPNVTLSLSKINLTFSEAWDMIKRELTVRKMNMYFVNNRAFQAVNPKKIREAYVAFCEENPPKENWKYQTITLRSNDKNSLQQAADHLSSHIAKHKPSPDELKNIITAFEKDCTIQISQSFNQQTNDIAAPYLQILQTIQEKQYSQPTIQKSRDNAEVIRLFYLDAHKKEEPVSFEEIAPKLKNQLLQEAAFQEAQKYTKKLRKQYGYEKEASSYVPENFQPYRIE